MSSSGFHALFSAESKPIPAQPKAKQEEEEDILDREKELWDSRQASRKVGKYLGGSAKTARQSAKVKGKKRKIVKKKAPVKRSKGGNLIKVINQLKTLAGVNKKKKPTKKRR